MPRKPENIPANETPAGRFVRVATKRTNQILTILKQMGTMGGADYVSSAEQRKQIEDAIATQTKTTIEGMTKGGVVQAFKLK